MTYAHIDRIGPGTCAVTIKDATGKTVDVCGCMPYDGIEEIEDADGVLVCVYCGHDIRPLLSDELVEVGR